MNRGNKQTTAAGGAVRATTLTRRRSFTSSSSGHGDMERGRHASASRGSYLSRQQQHEPRSNPPQQQQQPTRPARAPKRWHSEDNSDVRTRIVEKLRTLFPALESANLNTATPATVVQRLEWMLYNAAHSRNEYANECSLERRVQALVTQQLDTAASTNASSSTASSPTSTLSIRKPDPEVTSAMLSLTSPRTPGGCQRQSCLKRPRRASISKFSIEETVSQGGRRATSYKRQRQEQGVNSYNDVTQEATVNVEMSAVNDNSTLFLNNDLDLVSQVFQFLDGDEVLRARSVNQFLAAHAPSMVFSLTLDARKLSIGAHLLAGDYVTKLMIKCTSLRRLVVTNSRNERTTLSDLPRGYGVPASKTSSQQRIQVHGFQILSQVTAAFHQKACLSLQALELRAPFEFATESDTILECLRSLVYRNVNSYYRGGPHKPAGLKHLILDSTFLGDARIQQLATLLQTSPAYFRDLKTLVLRGNFAGEAGCQALFRTLHNCPRLRELDMSGNIMTDTDAMTLADALEHSVLVPVAGDEFTQPAQPFSLLQKMMLHENYIGLDGFYALSSAICTRLLDMSDEEMDARGNEKSLIDVCCEKNCAPLKKAERLFLF